MSELALFQSPTTPDMDNHVVRDVHEPVRVIALRDHPVHVYLARLAPSTKRPVRNRLEEAARVLSDGRCTSETFPWWRLEYRDLNAWRAHVVATKATSTAQQYLWVVCALLKECKRLGLMTADQYDRAVDVPPILGETVPFGRHVAADEIARLWQHMSSLDTATAKRDMTALAILRSTGMRRAEVCRLTLADYNRDKASLKVQGKRGKQRVVFLAPWAQEALENWLAWRGTSPGALLTPTDRHGTCYTDRPMSPDTLYYNLKRRIREAGVKSFATHDLRRTFAGDLLEAGHDVGKVGKALGHSSPTTTARYDRRPDAARRNMAASIPSPF